MNKKNENDYIIFSILTSIILAAFIVAVLVYLRPVKPVDKSMNVTELGWCLGDQVNIIEFEHNGNKISVLTNGRYALKLSESTIE